MSQDQLDHLCKIANSHGGTVIISSNPLSFNSDTLTIKAPFKWEIEDLYGLAHEIGHLIDHLENKLDYNLWRNNAAYRLNAEMKAWTNSYDILIKAGIDTSHWSNHVRQKLSTYLEFPYQSLDALEAI